MITITAPAGIGEVLPGADLVAIVGNALAADGGLTDGDVVVVTSKIVSKAEGRQVDAMQREDRITEAATETVARRGATRIVRTPLGLTIAAAGVDNSNVTAGTILLLPEDPDASAARIRAGLADRFGVRLAVVVSDTAGRAWRIGQTDHAIGSAGLRVIQRYDGRTDDYGNELQVTAVAIADEVAAAADLAKAKLAGRPVALLRGLAEHVLDDAALAGPDSRAQELVRAPEEDMFRRGAREAVVEAVLAAGGCADAYDTVIALPPAELSDDVVRRLGVTGRSEELVRAMLAVALR